MNCFLTFFEKDEVVRAWRMDSGKSFQDLVVLGIKDRWKQDRRFLGSERSDELRRLRWVASCRVGVMRSVMYVGVGSVGLHKRWKKVSLWVNRLVSRVSHPKSLCSLSVGER